MKQTIKITLSAVCLLALALSLVSCFNTVDKVGAWESAIYRKDVELGEGSKTVAVEVKAEDSSITITLHTDAKTLGQALQEQELLEGENGDYGLYVKKVNGILADYDVDKTYWGLYKNGEYLMTGVDTTEIADGEHYELVKTK
jgi:hypothetical protein